MIVIKEYLCSDCDCEFEVELKHNRQCRTCVECKSKNIERLISAPIISKLNGPRTLGTLIESNNKKNPLSKEKSVGSDTENKQKKEGAERSKKLNNMTPEQKSRYIMTGEGL